MMHELPLNRTFLLKLALTSTIVAAQLTFMNMATPGQSLEGDERTVCKCDFSDLRPLVITHPLVDATVKRVEPQYPVLARRSGIQGKVEVRILVDRNGEVTRACTVDGPPLLLSAAKDAALQWKFKKNFGLTNRPKQRYIESSLVFTFSIE